MAASVARRARSLPEGLESTIERDRFARIREVDRVAADAVTEGLEGIEEVMLDAIFFGHQVIQPILDAQEKLKDHKAARTAYTKYLSLAGESKIADEIRKKLEKLK